MTPLQNALRILAFVAALFLIFLIIWLFRCNCRRGAIEPNGAVGQPTYYALVAPDRTEVGKYRAA